MRAGARSDARVSRRRAPSVRGPARSHSKPQRTSAASLPPGAMNVTPNGTASIDTRDGKASAASPSRLTKFVYRPSSALRASGSAATAARVGQVTAVGTINASTRAHIGAMRARSSSSR